MAKLIDQISPDELLIMIRSGTMKNEIIKEYKTSDEELAMMLLQVYRAGKLEKEEFNNFFKGLPLNTPPPEKQVRPEESREGAPTEEVRVAPAWETAEAPPAQPVAVEPEVGPPPEPVSAEPQPVVEKPEAEPPAPPPEELMEEPEKEAAVDVVEEVEEVEEVEAVEYSEEPAEAVEDGDVSLEFELDDALEEATDEAFIDEAVADEIAGAEAVETVEQARAEEQVEADIAGAFSSAAEGAQGAEEEPLRVIVSLLRSIEQRLARIEDQMKSS